SSIPSHYSTDSNDRPDKAQGEFRYLDLLQLVNHIVRHQSLCVLPGFFGNGYGNLRNPGGFGRFFGGFGITFGRSQSFRPALIVALRR
ncbi:MAG: hypothetical protein VYC44_05820, partial [Chloroflexota bacterium]|nr:hypothetical protein [Chloroflexota bacterium]